MSPVDWLWKVSITTKKWTGFLLLFWKNISFEEMHVHEHIALMQKASINDYSKNYCMEVYQNIKSSIILYHLDIYLLEDKTRQSRHQITFKRENPKENIMF